MKAAALRRGAEWNGQSVGTTEIRLIVFDFDGTLSWLRHGWPEMMCEAFAPHYPPLEQRGAAETQARLFGEILALNGQPSIRQCQRLAELRQAHDGTVLDAEALRVDFQSRLDAAIARRSARVRSGEEPPSAYHIAGAEPFLRHAAATGCELAILSSTVQARLEEEAELLGLRRYFGRHVYGGTGDPLRFSKRAVFERMLAEEKLTGKELLAIGDGPTEILATKALGGLALGLCSGESTNGTGEFDEHKRTALLAAGADVLLADFQEAAPVLDRLLGR